MKIGEIEKLSGISAKTIRYYETKGLSQIKRGENAYREYGEEDLTQLQTIALLRKCGCSIAAIKDVTDGKCTLVELLEKQIHMLEKQKWQEDLRLSILYDMQKSFQKSDASALSAWLQTLKEIETDEFQQLHEDVQMLTQHSPLFYVVWTLILSGPILTLFLKIDEHNTAYQGLLTLLSLADMSVLTLLWRKYFTTRHQFKERKKRGWILLLWLPFSLCIGFLFIFVIQWLKELLYLKDGYILWSSTMLADILPFFFLIEAMVINGAYIAKKTHNIDFEDYQVIFHKLKRYRFLMLFVNLIVLYISLTNINVLYPSHLETARWYAPILQTNDYQNITKVKTGFQSAKSFLSQRNKGDFYYFLYLKDGKKIDISMPNAAHEKRYEEHTYLEIEECDAIFMQLGIKKEGSMQHFQDNTLAAEYRNRFKKIVENKTK